MGNYKRKDHKAIINSIVGVDDIFKGEFLLKGAIKVDGTLIGDITTDSALRISKTGNGKGVIRAKDIIIAGEFIGDLFAQEHVVLQSSAYVKGNISAAFLVLEDGAYYSGQCKVTHQESPDLTSDINDFSDPNLFFEEDPDPNIEQKKLLGIK